MRREDGGEVKGKQYIKGIMKGIWIFLKKGGKEEAEEQGEGKKLKGM